MLNNVLTWLKSQGRFVAVYLGIAAIVIPTWAAIYYGQSGDENAVSSLKVAREQLFYQQVDEMKGLSPSPIETTDPAGTTFEISGQHVYRKETFAGPASGPISQGPLTESPQPKRSEVPRTISPQPGSEGPLTESPQPPSPSRSPGPPAAAPLPPIAAEPQSNVWHSIWPFVILGAAISLVVAFLANRILPRRTAAKGGDVHNE
jgi:hypothetical protein